MENLIDYLKFRLTSVSLPVSIGVIDIVQILLIAVFVYYLVVWVKSTRAYILLQGLLLVVLFLLVAVVLHMDTILWIFKQLSGVLITGMIVIFQP